jgi:hypothetical protein
MDVDGFYVFRINQGCGALNVIDFLPDTPLVRLVNG